MSEELLGLIFAILWFTGVVVAWFYAIFKGYDKIWSEKAIEFQNKFAFFELHRRFNKAWQSPFMVRVVLSFFLIIGVYILYLTISDFTES